LDPALKGKSYSRSLSYSQQNFSPRLHEAGSEIFEYSALSHYWETSPIVITATAKLSDRRTAIPWDILSNTFNKAIIVTHELGMRYIWIDSLCILQDDIMDSEENSRFARGPSMMDEWFKDVEEEGMTLV
jgi:hypothetical protein